MIILKKCWLRRLTAQISRKNADELDEILKAVVLRYGQLLPEQEVVCLFLPKQDPAERQRILSGVEGVCFSKRNG